MIDVKVNGAEELARLARDLKAAGDKDLRKELFRSIQRSAGPAKEAARRSASENLPNENGLADEVAASRFSVRTRTGRDPSVRITGTGRANEKGKEHDLNALDRGRIRHPLYGNRGHWYTQQVKPGWFSGAMEGQAPAVREELLKAIDEIKAKLGAK